MVLLKSLCVWAVMMTAESIHGILRTLLLEPYVGDFKARQIAVFSGSAIVLGIAVALIRWIGASKTRHLLGIGLLWLALTLGFELVLGRLVMHYSWARLASDYNLLEGGLLPLGLLILAASPYLAAQLRRLP